MVFMSGFYSHLVVVRSHFGFSYLVGSVSGPILGLCVVAHRNWDDRCVRILAGLTQGVWARPLQLFCALLFYGRVPRFLAGLGDGRRDGLGG